MTSFEKQGQVKQVDDESDDPVEQMIKNTGCINFHYAVQVCVNCINCINFVMDYNK